MTSETRVRFVHTSVRKQKWVELQWLNMSTPQRSHGMKRALAFAKVLSCAKALSDRSSSTAASAGATAAASASDSDSDESPLSLLPSRCQKRQKREPSQRASSMAVDDEGPDDGSSSDSASEAEPPSAMPNVKHVSTVEPDCKWFRQYVEKCVPARRCFNSYFLRYAKEHHLFYRRAADRTAVASQRPSLPVPQNVAGTEAFRSSSGRDGHLMSTGGSSSSSSASGSGKQLRNSHVEVICTDLGPQRSTGEAEGVTENALMFESRSARERRQEKARMEYDRLQLKARQEYLKQMQKFNAASHLPIRATLLDGGIILGQKPQWDQLQSALARDLMADLKMCVNMWAYEHEFPRLVLELDYKSVQRVPTWVLRKDALFLQKVVRKFVQCDQHAVMIFMYGQSKPKFDQKEHVMTCIGSGAHLVFPHLCLPAFSVAHEIIWTCQQALKGFHSQKAEATNKHEAGVWQGLRGAKVEVDNIYKAAGFVNLREAYNFKKIVCFHKSHRQRPGTVIGTKQAAGSATTSAGCGHNSCPLCEGVGYLYDPSVYVVHDVFQGSGVRDEALYQKLVAIAEPVEVLKWSSVASWQSQPTPGVVRPKPGALPFVTFNEVDLARYVTAHSSKGRYNAHKVTEAAGNGESDSHDYADPLCFTRNPDSIWLKNQEEEDFRRRVGQYLRTKYPHKLSSDCILMAEVKSRYHGTQLLGHLNGSNMRFCPLQNRVHESNAVGLKLNRKHKSLSFHCFDPDCTAAWPTHPRKMFTSVQLSDDILAKWPRLYK